jgi:hypothetical protein
MNIDIIHEEYNFSSPRESEPNEEEEAIMLQKTRKWIREILEGYPDQKEAATNMSIRVAKTIIGHLIRWIVFHILDYIFFPSKHPSSFVYTHKGS